MSDYIKREDARKVCVSTLQRDRIDGLPSADVVDVVRCKDCRHFAPDAAADDSYYDGICRSPKTRLGWYQKKEDFCSAGERKKDKRENLWCTDWSAVATIARVKAAQFRESNSAYPTIVIVPCGSISEMREECSEYMTCSDAEPVRFCGLRVIESLRIKNYAEIEVY